MQNVNGSSEVVTTGRAYSIECTMRNFNFLHVFLLSFILIGCSEPTAVTPAVVADGEAVADTSAVVEEPAVVSDAPVADEPAIVEEDEEDNVMADASAIVEESVAVSDAAEVDASAPVEADDVVVKMPAVIEVDFIESAPKDRFVITNVGNCALEAVIVEFDLSQSAGKLIFDTTGTGAGVEVFQPFEVVAGEIEQVSAEGVQDGDSTLALRITNLAASDSASFTIDVDDTLTNSELGMIRVSGSEITGGMVQITIGDTTQASASFDAASTALVQLPTCMS